MWHSRTRLKAIAVGLAAAGWLLCAPIAARGAEGAIDARHHPWGRFEAGAWKLVRVTTETLDDQGATSSVSTAETRTTLVQKMDDAVVLETRTTLEVAGKRFTNEPQSTTQAYAGENGEKAAAKDLPPETLTIDGQKILCRVQQFDDPPGADGEKTKTIVYVSDDVPPFVLKRESVTTAGTDVVAEHRVDVVALSLPWKVMGDIKDAALVRSAQRHTKGSAVSWSLFVSDVPGGVVSQTAKELDKTGRVTRRSTLEVVDYGLERDDDRAGANNRLKRRPRHREGL